MSQRAQPSNDEPAATSGDRQRGLIPTIWADFVRRRALPIRQIALEAARYAIARVTAPLHLRGCDRVGESARTTGGEPVVDNRGRIEIGDELHPVTARRSGRKR